MYINNKISDVLNDLNSTKAMPGGGSVTAIVGSLATALARMTGHISMTKKSFKELNEGIIEEYTELWNDFEEDIKTFNKLVDEDMQAFESLLPHFKNMDSEEFKDKLDYCIEVPFTISSTALSILEKLPFIIEFSHKFIVSDAIVASELLYATVRASLVNVMVNSEYVADEELKTRIYEEIETRINDAKEISEEIYNNYFNKIKKVG